MEAKRLQLFWCRLRAGLIVATIQVRGDRQTRLGSGGADEAEDLLIAVEGLARPVLGDLGEEAMLDGIPLGRARGIVRHGEGEAEDVHELGLEFGFPGAAAIAIAAAGIAEEEQAACPWIADAAVVLPPARDGVGGKGRRVVRDADGDAAAIGEQIVDAVGDGHADGIRAEVVIVDQRAASDPSVRRGS